MSEQITLRQIVKMIDHSLLHPTMTDAEISAGIELARKYHVAAVCVKPYSVKQAAELLKSSEVAVCAVIGFPHGNSTLGIKVDETNQVIADGASEVDMVVNIGKVLSGEWEYVHREVKAVNEACLQQKAILKVIFETDYLGDEAVIHLCKICSQVGVAFVKTSTGYGFVKKPDGNYNYTGATDHALRLMRQHCAPAVQIKASGGVRSLDDVLRVRALGVTRVGATATEVIVRDALQRGIY